MDRQKLTRCLIEAIGSNGAEVVISFRGKGSQEAARQMLAWKGPEGLLYVNGANRIRCEEATRKRGVGIRLTLSIDSAFPIIRFINEVGHLVEDIEVRGV